MVDGLGNKYAESEGVRVALSEEFAPIELEQPIEEMEAIGRNQAERDFGNASQFYQHSQVRHVSELAEVPNSRGELYKDEFTQRLYRNRGGLIEQQVNDAWVLEDKDGT